MYNTLRVHLKTGELTHVQGCVVRMGFVADQVSSFYTTSCRIFPHKPGIASVVPVRRFSTFMTGSSWWLAGWLVRVTSSLFHFRLRSTVYFFRGRCLVRQFVVGTFQLRSNIFSSTTSCTACSDWIYSFVLSRSCVYQRLCPKLSPKRNLV